MNLKSKVAEAVWDGLCPGIRQTAEDVEINDRTADLAIEAVRTHAKTDDYAAHQVALFVSLRQAACETPIQFVKRIVGAWLEEAAPVEDVVEELVRSLKDDPPAMMVIDPLSRFLAA